LARRGVAAQTGEQDCISIIAACKLGISADPRSLIGIKLPLHKRSSLCVDLVMSRAARRLRTMSPIAERIDEKDLERRIQRQKTLVARLVSEGKSAIEANAELYELSNALCSLHETQRQLSGRSPTVPR